MLQIGQTLTVPAAVSRVLSFARRTYTVRPGDTLEGIALRDHTTAQAIASANGISLTSLLRIGQRLIISITNVASAKSSVSGSTASGKGHTTTAQQGYVVRPGDTLSAIADRYNVSVEGLQTANDLTSTSLIQIGQTLKIPTSAQAVSPRPSVTVGERIVATATRFLGVPYVWGGTTPAGFDCSGLVQYVFGLVGLPVGRTATDQWNEGTPVSRANLAVGDLVFFNTTGGVSHVGIYIGNGDFIHAPSAGDVVQISRLSDSYWVSTYLGARWLG